MTSAQEDIQPSVVAVINQCGLGSLPPEVRLDLSRALEDRLMERVGKILMSRMSPSEVAEFERLHAGDDPNALSAWMAEVVPDSVDVVNRQLDLMRIELLRRAEEVRAVVAPSAERR